MKYNKMMQLTNRYKFGNGFTLLIALLLPFIAVAHQQILPKGNSCFCKFHENVDECACSLNSVDEFNNALVYPLLQQLLQRNYFRYYKVNMEKTCPFWPDERQCGSQACGIENCDDEVPEAIKVGNYELCRHGNLHVQANENSRVCSGVAAMQHGNTLDPLITHISGDTHVLLNDMDTHEFMDENKFCDVDDEIPTDMHYVDLARNPERYTGYSGNSAQMVWKAIYQENCFKPNPKFDKNFLLYPSVSAVAGFGTTGTWKRNLDMFRSRFSPETTWGEGPRRLKNLYFVYLLELRALHKLAPYLHAELFYTGDAVEDEQTRQLMYQLRDAIGSFPDHFDETVMFQQGREALARELKEEFRLHLWNVSRIMDCVGCDKCRLWGKLQTHGLGTAMRVLFSDIIGNAHQSSARDQQRDHLLGGDQISPIEAAFHLTRNDIVALLQSFGRFSTSIYEVAEFRRVLDN